MHHTIDLLSFQRHRLKIVSIWGFAPSKSLSSDVLILETKTYICFHLLINIFPVRKEWFEVRWLTSFMYKMPYTIRCAIWPLIHDVNTCYAQTISFLGHFGFQSEINSASYYYLSQLQKNDDLYRLVSIFCLKLLMHFFSMSISTRIESMVFKIRNNLSCINSEVKDILCDMYCRQMVVIHEEQHTQAACLTNWSDQLIGYMNSKPLRRFRTDLNPFQ